MALPSISALSKRQIEQIGLDVCRRFNLSERDVPLDLEEIAQIDLKMDVILKNGIISLLGSPASLAYSKKESRPVIYVDFGEHERNTGYYRYSLAHEIAHWLLHKELIIAISESIDSFSSWKDVLLSHSEEDYDWIEWQAEELASFLVAPAPLFDPALANILRDKIMGNPALANVEPDTLQSYLANPVSSLFGMSNAAAQARMRKSQIWKDFESGRPI